jgi:hypothetical protein
MARTTGRKTAYGVRVRKPEGKGPFERLRSTHKDNTKMDRKEIGWERVHWINAAQDKEK